MERFNVMLRFRKLIRREILFKLYKAYILPHFYYCSSVWHFCGARDADKLEALNKRILIDLYLEITRLHTTLFSQKSTLLRYVTNAFKISSYCYIRVCFSLNFPAYMNNMFSLRSSSYDLHGNYIFSLSKPKTTTYGLNSFSYFSAKQWNALPDFFRTSFFADFKTKIQDVTFM